MKINFLLISIFAVLFASCQDDGQVFEKSADERAEEAIASLKEKLTAPPNGWIVKYQPEQESGSFNVLLKFDENNNVNIKTDLGVNEGEFYDQTITYRIDNSLGLELIFETYSFFSYLFEQDRATFGAEYEFNYVNETNGVLVFNSKTDSSSPTIILFQPASAGDENQLGIQVANNLNKLDDNLSAITSVYKLSYTNKDLAFYLSFDDFRRTINFTYAAPKSGTERGQALTFSTPYIIQGDSMVFDNPLTGTFMGHQVSISGIRFNELTSSTITDVCPEPINIGQYTGTIASTPIILENTLFDPHGANFNESNSFFYSLHQNIFDNGVRVGDKIAQDVSGSLAIVLYYENVNGISTAIGFHIVNESGSVTRALREFTPILNGNQIQFEFAPNYTLIGDTTATINEEAMDVYLNKLTEGGTTYILKNSEGIYEFYNPCNGWSFGFIAN